jgi:guanylate kinase
MLKRFPDMRYSVSYTTRSPRGDEKNGIDYHFISKDEFETGIGTGLWAEWAEVHGNYYGTSARFINRELAAGKDILLDIDVQGTLQVLEHYKNAVTFFIMPPSLDTLRQRLESRGTDSPQTIDSRLIKAKEEIAQKQRYHHIIVNDDLAAAVSELVSLIENYRSP